MQINIYAEGFQLTSQLRAFVDLRLLSALGPFRDRIESAFVHLRARNARSVPDTTRSDVVVRLIRQVKSMPEHNSHGWRTQSTERPKRLASALRTRYHSRSRSQSHLASWKRRVDMVRSRSCWTATELQSFGGKCSKDPRTTCGRDGPGVLEAAWR